MKDIESEFRLWQQNAILDNDLIKELETMDNDAKKDAFYRDLEFGTGGLRGKIGVGTNRMNVYTVARASQGIASFIVKHFSPKNRKVAISRDTRLKSDLFANITAQVFAANGIKVEMFPYVTPVPVLSFGTHYLYCAFGIMITASHNPSEYNGYKVYNADGCQITNEIADAIFDEINAVDIFNGIKLASLDTLFQSGCINYIKPNVLTAFIDEVKALSVLYDDIIDKNISIVYSPLNGTGLVPVTRSFYELGYKNISIVKEQQFPNGYFPTCKYPNPEEKEAMSLGIKYCLETGADLLIATDPDCDRVGIAVKDSLGEYRLMSGNEVGILLLDYICSRRLANKTMPENPVVIKTIVTTDMAEEVAKNYGVQVVNVLTGFKYIGEKIGELQRTGREKDFIFGFEESYGYLTGTHVRDKDGVNAATMIAEMCAFYKQNGISLVDRLSRLYDMYGYYYNTLHSYTFEGRTGLETMQKLMDDLRNCSDFSGDKILKREDFSLGLFGLPKSNVLKFYLSGNRSVTIRPSGTEPKIKIYVSVCAKNKVVAENSEKKLIERIGQYILY